MKHVLLKKINRVLLSLILVSTFCFTPLTPLLAPEKTHAALSVTDALNIVQTTFTAIASKASAAFDGITSGATNALVVKEYSLDIIAWALVNKVLQSLIQSTTDWINSGFNGKPAFVQDMQGFVLDVADKYALGFIYGGNLDALCSPFKLNVQLALEISYANTREYYAGCRLSDAVTNLDGFLNGDFAGGGGWGAWYDITLNPEMHPTGALFLAEGALNAGVSNARAGTLFEINLGQGFLSKKDPNCDENLGPCPIITPGQTIQQTLQTALNIPAGRLTIADEFNEMLGALFSQLANQALSGAGGLLGLTNSYDASGNNYFDRMRSDVPPTQDIGDPTIPYFPPPPPPDYSGSGGPVADSGVGLVVSGNTYIHDRGTLSELFVPRCVPTQYDNCSYGARSRYDTLKAGDVWAMRIPFGYSSTASFFRYQVERSERGEQLTAFDIAISTKVGDFNPANENCKKSGSGASIAVYDPITIPEPSPWFSGCPLTRNTMYYLNVRPAQGSTGETLCGTSDENACRYRIVLPSTPDSFYFTPTKSTPTPVPAGVKVIDTGSITTNWAQQIFFPSPSAIYTFKVTIPSDFVKSGNFSAINTSVSPRAKRVVLSESPGVFEPLGGQASCDRLSLDGSTIKMTTDPMNASSGYYCNVTSGKTYYLNTTSMMPDGTYSCTDTTTCSFYASRSAPF